MVGKKRTPPDLVQEISAPWSRVTGRTRHAWVVYDPKTGARKAVHLDPAFPFDKSKKLIWLPCYTVPAKDYDTMIATARQMEMVLDVH